MPLYEFELVNERTGKVEKTLSLPLAVDDRNKIKLRRAELPRSIAVSGHAENPNLQGNQVRRGLKRIEQRMGTNEMQRRFGDMPLSTVKKVWKDAT